MIDFPKVLIIDRDGTLLKEPEDYQIDSFDKFEFVEKSIWALKEFQKMGYFLILATNQDYLGSKGYPWKIYNSIQDLFLKILESEGISFDEISLCPHGPDEGCLCRKPLTGLLPEWVRKGKICKEFSFVIGDRESDLKLAENLGLKGFQISNTLNWESIVQEILNRGGKSFSYERKTKETEVRVSANLLGKGPQISTGIGFFDHLLEQFAFHSNIQLKIEAKGDLHIDDHHLIEDVGLTLGKVLNQCVGDKKGMKRYSWFHLPMDEAKCSLYLDLSGRPLFKFKGRVGNGQWKGVKEEMIPHFFHSLCQELKATCHLEVTGENSHHMVEGQFKALGRAFGEAIKLGENQNESPSTKGVL